MNTNNATLDGSLNEDEIRTLLYSNESKTTKLKIGKNGGDLLESKKRENVTSTVSPDSGWGWIVVLGSFFVHLITDGLLYSFGILYIEFLNQYEGSKGETAWIGSLATGLQLVTGPIASVLTNKFGCRATTIIGAIVTSVGFILSAFSPSLYFLYFSFGILSGLGFGLTYFPAVVCVAHYFESKRTLAMGLASCGSGIGAFILNPLSKYLIDVYGWRGTLLIQAGIQLNCILCGALFRPLTKQKQPVPQVEGTERKFFTQMENFNNTNNILETTDKVSSLELSHLATVQQNGTEHEPFQSVKSLSLCPTVSKRRHSGEPAFHSDKHEHTVSHCKEGPLQTCIRENSSSHNFGKDEKLKHEVKSFAVNLCSMMSKACNLSQFKNVMFIFYLISNVLISFSLLIPFIFLYDRAIEMGIDTASAKWLGAIIGITNTVGRVFSGILADKLKINKIMLFSSAIIVVGVSTAICPLCTNFTWLVAFSCVFGLSYGIYIPLMSVVIVDILGKQMLTNAFGLLLMCKGVANLIGPPFAGWLYDKTESYNAPFIVAGINITIAGVMLALVICVTKRKRNVGCESEMKMTN
ncbi:monocarboxylate transporter 12-like [Ruditapes philippinarum]|uniref:monocarboxylate transporter 12-like n=1 Tax=Ruditapes philippinarum TaxID=129788 RepID=UPI00295BD7D0|nr:monocarboxylate transporter 12-like [Ruditapes philippinarum]